MDPLVAFEGKEFYIAYIKALKVVFDFRFEVHSAAITSHDQITIRRVST